MAFGVKMKTVRTKGIFGLGSMVGSNVKKCEQLVDATAKELEALNL